MYTLKIKGSGASFYEPRPTPTPQKSSGAAGLVFGVFAVLGLLALANYHEKRGRKYSARAARLDAIHEATR